FSAMLPSRCSDGIRNARRLPFGTSVQASRNPPNCYSPTPSVWFSFAATAPLARTAPPTSAAVHVETMVPSVLPAGLRREPRGFQLPIAPGVDLLLPPCRHA